jgi:putative membrane protein insertion efficiency factor
VNIFGHSSRKAQQSQGSQQGKERNKWEDCLPDCGDCGSPSCDCDVPGCDCGFMVLSAFALLLRPARGRPRRRHPAPTAPGRVGMAAIRGYQKWLSPRLRARCRHTPNCSAYGMEAVRRYGLIAGSQLTADRIRRCKAPTPHGTPDPVP